MIREPAQPPAHMDQEKPLPLSVPLLPPTLPQVSLLLEGQDLWGSCQFLRLCLNPGFCKKPECEHHPPSSQLWWPHGQLGLSPAVTWALTRCLCAPGASAISATTVPLLQGTAATVLQTQVSHTNCTSSFLGGHTVGPWTQNLPSWHLWKGE